MVAEFRAKYRTGDRRIGVGIASLIDHGKQSVLK